jgi:hypothetical protein
LVESGDLRGGRHGVGIGGANLGRKGQVVFLSVTFLELFFGEAGCASASEAQFPIFI